MLDFAFNHFDDGEFATHSSEGHETKAVQWSVVVPFHNEVDYLRRCIESLAQQTVGFELILVDNASTDGSGSFARRLCDVLGIEARHLVESRPGKVAALQTGIAKVRTEFVATCDADTIYPPKYLETAGRLLDDPACVAAIAATTAPEASKFEIASSGLRLWLTSLLLPQQCLNGGAGQVFRTEQLRECGGFDPLIWKWVLEDHEIMARIEALGTIAYAAEFICHPSQRPKAVDCRGWRFTEQLRYHLTTNRSRSAFFHHFLAQKLHERALSSEQLRRSPQVQLVA